MVAPVRLLILSLCACLLASCSALRAPAAATSHFLTHAKDLSINDSHSPFLANWTGDNAQEVLGKRKNIYIAPVNLDHLRPMGRSMSAAEHTEKERFATAQKLAAFASKRLTEAFKKSPAPRYTVVEKPDRKSISVELAFIELNPNPISGGVFRTAVGVVAAPGVDSVLFKRLKGNIAMEGRVIDNATKRPILEFADNQENKSALILSINDLTAYGQARQAIEEWALQIEEVLRTPPSHKVSRTSAFVFLPWN